VRPVIVRRRKNKALRHSPERSGGGRHAGSLEKASHARGMISFQLAPEIPAQNGSLTEIRSTKRGSGHVECRNSGA